MSIYQDRRYSIDERAQDLLSLMTVEEKIAQMHVHNNLAQLAKDIDEGKVNNLFGVLFDVRATDKKIIDKIQKYALEKTRLGIPLLLCGEGLHGFLYPKATIFPQSIGLSCSFNEKLVEDVAKVVGQEAYSLGTRQLFVPNLDLARELRWGRVQEDYGEDPYLVGKLGSACVRGIQASGVAATLKHYVAHGMPENGINLSSVHMGEREIRELMLPPFEECLKAGAMSVMPAYNELDGTPMHASKKWVNDVLREELGFDGTVISDWGGVAMLNSFHQTAQTSLEAGKQAINAGVDIEAPEYYGYGDKFLNAVKNGEIDEKLVDRAVLRILKLKFKLGLFDGKAISSGRQKFHSAKSVRLARKAAEQSIVLLKNDGVLPFSDKKQKIALIGPNAKTAQIGSYSYFPTDENLISLYEGLKRRVGEENLFYAKGCDLANDNEVELKRAVAAAIAADVVILALGDNSNFYGGVGWGNEEIVEPVTCGEGFDMHYLELPAAQRKLFNELAKTGKKIVLVLYSGRPQVIVDEYERSSAVLQAWYPGEQGGIALTDILFGDVNPTGKLTVSFPRSTGHLPCYYNHRTSARGYYKKPGTPQTAGRDYVFSHPSAFLPFGYGVGYVPFAYQWVRSKNLSGGGVEIRVKLSNLGDKEAEESVLVFLSCQYCEVVPYKSQLKAFKRVRIGAGKSKTVRFVLDESAFYYVNHDMQKKVAKGKYTVRVADQETTFEI